MKKPATPPKSVDIQSPDFQSFMIYTRPLIDRLWREKYAKNTKKMAMAIPMDYGKFRELYFDKKAPSELKKYYLDTLNKIAIFLEKGSFEKILRIIEEERNQDFTLIQDAELARRREISFTQKELLDLIEISQNYFIHYDFDKPESWAKAYSKYGSAKIWCKEAEDWGLKSPLVTKLKLALIPIASDLFYFQECKRLRDSILKDLEDNAQYSNEEKAQIKFRLDIFSDNDLAANLSQYRKAKQIFAGNPIKKLFALNRLGFSYLSENQTLNAQSIFKKCEQIASSIIYPNQTLENYQKAYLDFYQGLGYYQNNQWDKALEYLKCAQKKFIQVFDRYQHYVGVISYLLSKIYEHKQDSILAKDFSEKARSIFRRLLGFMPNDLPLMLWLFETRNSQDSGTGYYERTENPKTISILQHLYF
jgi:hypothetical protein